MKQFVGFAVLITSSVAALSRRLITPHGTNLSKAWTILQRHSSPNERRR